jgi:hypothetical protein
LRCDAAHDVDTVEPANSPKYLVLAFQDLALSPLRIGSIQIAALFFWGFGLPVAKALAAVCTDGDSSFDCSVQF